MKTDLNDLFKLIQYAKQTKSYSKHEINFFFDVWQVMYDKYLRDKYSIDKNDQNDKNEA